jgi:hypothetical protein
MGYTVLYKRLTLTQDSNSATGIDESIHAMCNNPGYWEALKDKATYDFRYIMHGLLGEDPQQGSGNFDNANAQIIKIAHYDNSDGDSGRGDCVALVDINNCVYEGKRVTEAVTAIKEAANAITASKYAAIFAPSVTYDMPVDSDYNNTTFPASFHYLACAKKANENYSE